MSRKLRQVEELVSRVTFDLSEVYTILQEQEHRIQELENSIANSKNPANTINKPLEGRRAKVRRLVAAAEREYEAAKRRNAEDDGR